MKHTIENERIILTIDDHGAELTGLYDKNNSRELVWGADPKFWKRHAPILFPNVGKHNGLEYRTDGKAYHIGQHGFARDRDFQLISEDPSRIRHRLVSDSQTHESYPYDFALDVTHEMLDSGIKVIWDVKKTGDETMYFTIGGHPAFNLPDYKQKEDFQVCIPDRAVLECKKLNLETGTALADITEIPLKDHILPLSDDLFAEDALVLDDGQVTEAVLQTADGQDIIKIVTENFPNYGIWSVKDAPFVCLEPWCGRCDDYSFNGELKDKKGINSVKPGEVFHKEYEIYLPK